MTQMNKLGYILQYKKYIIIGLSIVLVQMMVTFAIPIIVRQIIGQAELGELESVKIYIYYIFLLIVAFFVLKTIRNYFFVRFSFDFKTNEAKNLFYSLFNANLFTIAKNGPTYYTERIYNGLLSMFTLVGDVSVRISTIALTIAVSLMLVYVISPIFSLLFFLLLPITYFAYKKLNKTLQVKSERLQQVNATNFQHIINLLQNFIEIKKIFDYELFSSLCKKYISKIEKENNRVAIYGQNTSNFIQLFTEIVKNGILIFAIYLLIMGRVGIAEVIFVEMILMIYANALSELTNININLRDINAFQKFVNTDILAQAEVDTGTTTLSDVNEISFNIEWFSYNKKRILENVELRIKKGECLGIVGDSGSGKSTLLNVLVRLYDVNGISLNNIPVQEYTMKSLRKTIYIVSQTPYIFPGTIGDNLVIGVPPETLESERIEMIFQSKFYKEFIREFPRGLETPIQEGASNLSGGQKQKIMVIRALLLNPLVLIMDEATAEMDGASEAAAMELIFREKQNKIVMIVSHRLSTVKMCDTLVVLKSGQIRDYGTLEHIVKSSEEFHRLFKSQLK